MHALYKVTTPSCILYGNFHAQTCIVYLMVHTYSNFIARIICCSLHICLESCVCLVIHSYLQDNRLNVYMNCCETSCVWNVTNSNNIHHERSSVATNTVTTGALSEYTPYTSSSTVQQCRGSCVLCTCIVRTGISRSSSSHYMK